MPKIKLIQQTLRKHDETTKPGDQIVNQKSNLRTFGTHQEMNETEAKEMASLSPTENIQNALDRIRKVFQEELKKPMDKKLGFR